jgi:hypothetical protein
VEGPRNVPEGGCSEGNWIVSEKGGVPAEVDGHITEREDVVKGNKGAVGAMSHRCLH